MNLNIHLVHSPVAYGGLLSQVSRNLNANKGSYPINGSMCSLVLCSTHAHSLDIPHGITIILSTEQPVS